MIDRRLIHYSGEPLGELRVFCQRKDAKPRGLWFSCEGEDDWKRWCEAENFRSDRFSEASQIFIKEDANILLIDSVFGIDALTREFIAEPGEGAASFLSSYFIDWGKVSETYQGIIISPYQWSRRLEGGASWYYGWDCASGCVWDYAAIEKIEKVIP